MWELGCDESWAPKNWCFWTVVLEKTLESPLSARRSNESILKEVSPGCSLEGLGVPPMDWSWNSNTLDPWCGKLTHLKRPLCWQRLRAGGKEDEVVGWHLWHNGHGFGWTLGVGDGQASLVCCVSWGSKALDTTEWLNWTELSPGFGIRQTWLQILTLLLEN